VQNKEIANALRLSTWIMNRLFLLINLLLITAISFLGVDTMYKIIAAQLEIVDRTRSTISKNSSSPVEIDAPPLSHYSAIVDRNIFHARTVNGAAKVEKIILDDIKPTERNLKLWGTVVGNGTGSTYAIIEEPGARPRRSNQMLYEPGDSVQGATIKKILREKVILSAEGKNEILQLVERKSSGRFRRPRPTPNQRRNQPIRQKRMLRSSQIQKAIGDISKLQSQAVIRPHAEGFQISRIRPRSIFRRMGLRNGDIITAVGGRSITSVDDALGILRDLTAGGETSVAFKRRGRMRIIDYNIR
jgi:general secretion pathway protein C